MSRFLQGRRASRRIISLARRPLMTNAMGLTGWAMINLLIFLESERCWLMDTRNPSNTSRPIWSKYSEIISSVDEDLI